MVSTLNSDPHHVQRLFQNVPGQIGTRHKQMVLSFFGLVVLGLYTAGVDVGIVAMTRPPDNIHSYPTLNFTIAQKGVLMSAGSYGYTVGSLLFGYLADSYGPMSISPIVGGICTGLVCLIYPSLIFYGGYAYTVNMRTLQGFLMSSVYPCVYAHMSKWVVPQEQSKFSWVWSGYPVGYLIVSTTAGPMAESVTGWPTIYHFIGSMAIIWGILTWRWGANCPSHHGTISHEEKMLIEKHLSPSRVKSKRTPWMDMLKSMPLWTFLLVQTLDWFFTDMVYPFQATFLTGVFNLSLQEAGLAVAYSQMVHIPTTFIFVYLAAKMEGCVSVNFSRKLWNTIGSWGEGMTFFILACTTQGPTSAKVLITVAYALSAAFHIGYVNNVLDFAPNFAGTITGSLSVVSNIGASFGGITTGFLVRNEADMESWRKIFMLGALVQFMVSLIFLTFGSTKLEHWNNNDDEEYEAEKLLD